jgi:hypothetical protein
VPVGSAKPSPGSQIDITRDITFAIHVMPAVAVLV